MKRVCLCLLTCLWPHLLLGPSSPPAMFRANLQRAGVFETEGVRRLHGVKWKFKTERVVEAWFSFPSVTDGVVYAGGAFFDDMFARRRIEPEDAEEQWGSGLRRVDREKALETLDHIEKLTSMPGKDGAAVEVGMPGIDGETLDLMVASLGFEELLPTMPSPIRPFYVALDFTCHNHLEKTLQLSQSVLITSALFE